MELLYIKNLASKSISSFEKSSFIAARKAGFNITFACNTSNIDPDVMKKDCEKYGVRLIHIDFSRSPFSLQNIKAYRQLLGLLRQKHYDVVHCNTPMGGVVGRLAARRARIPYVIYQAHGFHFWKGAPLFNWLCYYPVERFLAHYTDLLITINQDIITQNSDNTNLKTNYFNDNEINQKLYFTNRSFECSEEEIN